MIEMSEFAQRIMRDKYSHEKEDGEKETWEEIAARVTKHVMRSVRAPKALRDRIERAIVERRFIPGGRYLANAGRPVHMTQNCLAGETRIVTREGTKAIGDLVGTIQTLMSTKGWWTSAPINSFGRQKLWQITLSRGTGIKIEKQLYATAEHSWRVAATLTENGRSQTKKEVLTKDLKKGDRFWQVFGHGVSRLPLSLAGIQHGIIFGDGCRRTDDLNFSTAFIRLCGDKNELVKYFPGYELSKIEDDVAVNGLPRLYKDLPSIWADRSYLAGWLAGYISTDGCVAEDGGISLASSKRENLEFVKDACYILGLGAYSIRTIVGTTNYSSTERTIYSLRFMRDTFTTEMFLRTIHHDRFEENPGKRRSSWIVEHVEPIDRTEEVFCATVPETHEFTLEDNILTGNCFTFLAEDSREGWAELLRNSTQSLMLGGGIGVVYSKIRPEGKSVRKTGGIATGPLPLIQAVNEVGRAIVNGGNRRCAIWAGLNWAHADIHKFITYKNWLPEVRALKEKDFSFPATLDMTNISVMLDEEFFTAYHDEKDPRHSMAQSVYWAAVKQMLKTSEPGFSIDLGKNKREICRNACCELTTEEDSDVCNLGSINLARVMTLAEMEDLVELATAFLLAGTVYSDVPYPKVDLVRTKNRRLGLGLMGLHEWLLLRGKPYGPDPDLERYLEVYASSGQHARRWAKEWDLSVPVKTRAIAPVGTIGIVGETTTGIEPIFCAAFKQRYWKGEFWAEEHVLDPTAKRLIDAGMVSPDQIEDAYVLARDVERRVAFQAWVQRFVDHAISSTINLPEWGSELNNENTVRAFGIMLMRYLPQLRGVTVYPDKARGGQPLVPVAWAEATEKVGQVSVASVDLCDVTKGGSCGA